MRPLRKGHRALSEVSCQGSVTKAWGTWDAQDLLSSGMPETRRPWGRALPMAGLARIHRFHPLVLLLLTFPPTKLRLQKSNQISEGTGSRSQVSKGVGQAPFLSAKSKSSQATKRQTTKISGGREGEKEVCLTPRSSRKALRKLGPGSLLDLFPYCVGTIRGPPNTTKFKMYSNQLKNYFILN